MRAELDEDALERRVGDFLAALERVVAVHQHLGLDDRHDAGLLAEGRVARQRMGIGVDREAARESPAPMSITARHLANRAPSSGYSSSRSRRPSRPSVIVSPGKPASAFAPASTLMPGIMPCWARYFGNGTPSQRLLAQGLVVQDHAADVARRRPGVVNSMLAVGAPALLRRFELDRVEALLDRAARLRRQPGCPCPGPPSPVQWRTSSVMIQPPSLTGCAGRRATGPALLRAAEE